MEILFRVPDGRPAARIVLDYTTPEPYRPAVSAPMINRVVCITTYDPVVETVTADNKGKLQEQLDRLSSKLRNWESNIDAFEELKRLEYALTQVIQHISEPT